MCLKSILLPMKWFIGVLTDILLKSPLTVRIGMTFKKLISTYIILIILYYNIFYWMEKCNKSIMKDN